MRVVGLLGGTFDPVHNGHLRIGYEIQQLFSLDELRYIPCADPPHKDSTGATAQQRSAMLQRAIANTPEFILDEREFSREGPSYTVDTLRSLRQESGDDVSLCWIVGSDSFQSLNTWHQWESIFDYAHIIVACRPGWQADELSEMGRLLKQRMVSDPQTLKQKNAGFIVPWQVTQLDISATAIREHFVRGLSPRFLVPQAVLDYIVEHKLYRQ